MKAIKEDTQRKIRRPAANALEVYDINTKLLIGHTLDLSLEGMKIMSANPVRVHHTYFCKILLTNEINGHKELFFDAECRWCRKNEESGKYNSGYSLNFSSAKDEGILNALLHEWMKNQFSNLNRKPKKEKKEKRRFAGIFGIGKK